MGISVSTATLVFASTWPRTGAKLVWKRVRVRLRKRVPLLAHLPTTCAARQPAQVLAQVVAVERVRVRAQVGRTEIHTIQRPRAVFERAVVRPITRV